MLGQAITIAQQGNHAKAASAAEITIKDPKTSAKQLMKAAAVFAGAVPIALHDDGLSAADQTALAEKYAVRAIALLNRARTLGHFKTAENRASLNEAPEWKELRKRDDFKKLCAQVEDH